jgi:hypothetical protein
VNKRVKMTSKIAITNVELRKSIVQSNHELENLPGTSADYFEACRTRSLTQLETFSMSLGSPRCFAARHRVYDMQIHRTSQHC